MACELTETSRCVTKEEAATEARRQRRVYFRYGQEKDMAENLPRSKAADKSDEGSCPRTKAPLRAQSPGEPFPRMPDKHRAVFWMRVVDL